MRPRRIFHEVEDSLINSLIAARDIHFVTTVIVAGIVFFDLYIAAPVLRSELRLTATEASFRGLAAKLLMVSLAVSVASAIAWLWLLAARIADKPFDEVVADGTVWIVLWQTQFGLTWAVRLLFAAALTLSLLLQWNTKAVGVWHRVLAALLASAYLGSLALAGHGGEGLGFEKNIHLAADILHLLAAGTWLGGLIPFAILLTYMRRLREPSWDTAARNTAGRFSTLGLFAVGILLVSGIINTTFLVGGLQGLTGTTYGQWLLIKIGLFIPMFCLATINRQYLLPRLCGSSGADQSVLSVQRLVLSTFFEIALGLAIIGIVGVLGISAPAIDMAAHMH
jgi:putative copper resistance protein D